MKRKTILGFLGMCLIAFLATAVSFLSTSCENPRRAQECTCEQMDSVAIADQMYAIANPSFGSVREVAEFQGRLVEQYSIDEIFRQMPLDILYDVATVCLRRDTRITKTDIVLEYRANYEIYNSLNSDTPSTVTDSTEQTAVEEQQLPATPPASNVSYYYRLDTIDGKPVKVLVKEESYESK